MLLLIQNKELGRKLQNRKTLLFKPVYLYFLHSSFLFFWQFKKLFTNIHGYNVCFWKILSFATIPILVGWKIYTKTDICWVQTIVQLDVYIFGMSRRKNICLCTVIKWQDWRGIVNSAPIYLYWNPCHLSLLSLSKFIISYLLFILSKY